MQDNLNSSERTLTLVLYILYIIAIFSAEAVAAVA